MSLRPLILTILSFICCSCGMNDYHLRIKNSKDSHVTDVVLEAKNKTTRISQIYPKAQWDYMFASRTFGSIPTRIQLQWKDSGVKIFKKEEVDLSSVPKNFEGIIVIKISDRIGLETVSRDVGGESPSIWRVPF